MFLRLGGVKNPHVARQARQATKARQGRIFFLSFPSSSLSSFLEISISCAAAAVGWGADTQPGAVEFFPT